MSRRIGHQELEEVRERLSERDLAIAAMLRRLRLMSARQVERLFFTDHASAPAAARICRRVLQRLVGEGVLVRLERRIGGVRAGSASFIYALGPVGQRLLTDGPHRWREPGAAFTHHTLAISELVVGLHACGARELLSFSAEPECWRAFSSAKHGDETLKPDLYVVTATREEEFSFFVEVDRGTHSLRSIQRKCRIYLRHFAAGVEQASTGVYPKVIFLTETEARASKLDATIGQLKRPELFDVDLLAEGPQRLLGDLV